MKYNGGGGIRTPVPRCFRISIYVRSRSICEVRLTQRRATGPAIGYSGVSRSVGPDDRRSQPTDWRPCQTRRRSPTGRAALFTQPWHSCSCHLEIRYRMINQANRCPGHASHPSAIRSMPFAPVFNCPREPRYFNSSFYRILRRTARHSFDNAISGTAGSLVSFQVTPMDCRPIQSRRPKRDPS